MHTRKTTFLLLVLIFLLAVVSIGITYRDRATWYQKVAYARELSEEKALQLLPEPVPKKGAVRVPILIYHKIQPDIPGKNNQQAYAISPTELDTQFAYLKKEGYTPISLDQLALFIDTATTSPVKKPVVLTFDDGWESQYTYAFPLLQKYGFTAAFYIYTNAVSQYSDYMTWDQIRDLLAHGMTIGDHTESHPHLSTLTPNELRTEIVGARTVLQDKLGISIKHFASPYGFTDSEVKQIVQESGFVTGRSTYHGVYHSAEDKYALRGYIVGRSMITFVHEVKE